MSGYWDKPMPLTHPADPDGEMTLTWLDVPLAQPEPQDVRVRIEAHGWDNAFTRLWWRQYAVNADGTPIAEVMSNSNTSIQNDTTGILTLTVHADSIPGARPSRIEFYAEPTGKPAGDTWTYTWIDESVLTFIWNPFTGAVTFTGVTPGSTVTRTDPVHGAVPVDVVDNGDGTATATDPWPPLNSDVEYVITEPDGTTTTTIVVETTVDGPDGPGSEPLPRLSVPAQPALELPPVTLIEYTGAYPARNTVHDILDRTDPVVVQRGAGLRRGELTYVFDDHGAAMQIADAYRTGAKVSLRQATHDRLDVVHIATGDVQITPEHGGLAWRLRVAYTEVAP